MIEESEKKVAIKDVVDIHILCFREYFFFGFFFFFFFFFFFLISF